MSNGQNYRGDYTVEEESSFYEDAESKLREMVSTLSNVTLLKKIYSSGFLKVESFDRLLELMVSGNADACLEVMTICKSSQIAKNKVNKMSFALGE